MRKLNKRGGEGIAGGKGDQSSRNMYTGHMVKAKGGRIDGGRRGQVGRGNGGGEMKTTVLEQQF